MYEACCIAAVIVVIVVLIVMLTRRGGCCSRRSACGYMHSHAAMQGSSSVADDLRDRLNGVQAFQLDDPLPKKVQLSASSAGLPDFRAHEVREFDTIIG